MKRLAVLITIAFSALFIFSAIQIFTINAASRERARTQQEMAQFVEFESETSALPEVNFTALREVNPDIVAWLYLEGTPLNLPVVQGTDNHFYLNHLFDGTRNAAGTLFVDYENSPHFRDSNTIIYGHNMRDGSMFGTLIKYSSQEFFEQNPTMLLLTPTANYKLELFAGYTTNTLANSWQKQFENSTEFEEWVAGRISRSDFVSSITPSFTDRLVTLSTCSYAFNNARYVLVGRLVQI